MIEKQMTSGGEETKKLYYEDSHRKEFKATVLSCEERLTAKGKKDAPGLCGMSSCYCYG